MTQTPEITPEHLDLADLIGALATEDPARVIPLGFHRPHSYRGDYCDLAFEPAQNIRIGDMLDAARSAVRATYEGWKGGEYTMGASSPCWLAHRGDIGETLGRTLLRLMLAAPAPAASGTATTEHERPARADQLRPGDQIEYAGAWRTVRTATTVTTLRTEEGWRLDYEADQPLTVRRPEPAPGEDSAGGCHRCNGSGVIPEHDGEDRPCSCADAERRQMACPMTHLPEMPCGACGKPVETSAEEAEAR